MSYDVPSKRADARLRLAECEERFMQAAQIPATTDQFDARLNDYLDAWRALKRSSDSMVDKPPR